MCEKETVFVPTFEGLLLAATKVHGADSHIFEQHRLITRPIEHRKVSKLHCIADGIVTEYEAENGDKYRLTLEVI